MLFLTSTHVCLSIRLCVCLCIQLFIVVYENSLNELGMHVFHINSIDIRHCQIKVKIMVGLNLPQYKRCVHLQCNKKLNLIKN